MREDKTSDGLTSTTTRASNCPPGLEILSGIEQMEMEVLQRWFTGRYNVNKLDGQNVYFIVDKSERCCGPKYTKVFHGPNEVIRMRRSGGWCRLCLLYTNIMKVWAPPDTVIGTIEYKFPSPISKIHCVIKNAAGNVVMRATPPPIYMPSFYMNLYSEDTKEKIGFIRQIWRDYTDFVMEVSCPRNIDVKTKAIVLGVCILLDNFYFVRRRLDSGFRERPGRVVWG